MVRCVVHFLPDLDRLHHDHEPRRILMSNANHRDASPIGRRIHVLGNTGAGKSTLGARVARALDVPFVELDALNWEPGWVGLNATNPQEFERRTQAATVGDGWVVAGLYITFAQRVFWPQLHTVVWLDLPLPLLVWRVWRRSWQRWRMKEVLWGTNMSASGRNYGCGGRTRSSGGP